MTRRSQIFAVGTRASLRGALISAIALGFAIAHAKWPDLAIDSTTVALVAIAMLPWALPLLSTWVDHVRTPGGFELTLRKAEDAAKLVLGKQTHPSPLPALRESLESLEPDPNLAIVALGIEIERRLRTLAGKHGLTSTHRTPIQIMNDLVGRGTLNAEAANGLAQLLRARNRAAHGALVEPEVRRWVVNEGARIVGYLDQVIADADGR